MPFISHRSKASDYELLSQVIRSTRGGDSDEESGGQRVVHFALPPPRPKRRGLCLTAVASVMLVVFALTLARSYHLLTPTYGIATYYTPAHLSATSAASNDLFSQPALAHNEAYDLSMNASTCSANFPAFYTQFTANEAYWKNKGGITQAVVDRVERSGNANANSRILTKEGQLFIRAYRPDAQSRTKSLFWLIHAALAANPTSQDGPMPDVDLAFSMDDKDGIELPGWAITTLYEKGAGQWLMPDFGFASWPEAGVPSMREVLREAAQIESRFPWSAKDARVYFRGDPNVYAERLDLMDRVKVPGAEKWADVKKTSFWEQSKAEAEIVPIWEHCKKRYLIHTEGNSYSGREKYIFSCRSAVIHHKLRWRTHWHGALISNSSSPHQNSIELAGPHFKGLEEMMHTLQADDKAFSSSTHLSKGERVASSSYRILAGRYLTPAATACYIRASFRSYASVMKGTVELKPGAGVAPGAGIAAGWEEKVHGDVAYETFLALGQPKWPIRG